MGAVARPADGEWFLGWLDRASRDIGVERITFALALRDDTVWPVVEVLERAAFDDRPIGDRGFPWEGFDDAGWSSPEGRAAFAGTGLRDQLPLAAAVAVLRHGAFGSSSVSRMILHQVMAA